MPRFFQGIAYEKKTIRENGFEEDVVITMTEDEYNDKPYREYLDHSTTERTREQLRKRKHPQRDPRKVKALAKAMKERTEYIERQKSEHSRKYY